MKKVQDNNPSTIIECISKPGIGDCLFESEAFRLFPEKDSWRKRLIFTLYKWARTEESDNIGGKKLPHLDIGQFCTEYGISRSSLFRWRDQYEDLKTVMDQVKIIIATRRRVGAMIKDFDKDVVFRDMHKYDPEWLEINKYHAALKKEEGASPSGIIYVEGPAAPHTGKIKKKEKADE